MKDQYVVELEPGVRVDSVFAVRGSELRLARTGEPYLWLELADRTGTVEAVRFRLSSRDATIPSGSVARVAGVVSSWRGAPSIRVEAFDPATDFERSDLIPATSQDTAALRRRLSRALASIAEPRLRRLVRDVFAEPGFAARFADCPATEAGHHAYLGGLLEHTVAVADSCARLSRGYPVVDSDLLTAAALLHDVGVVDALEFDTTVAATDRGRLLGHAQLGVERLRAAAAGSTKPLDPRSLARLTHAILSHHGGDGSAHAPSTVEALVLASADSLDARMWSVECETARAARSGASWSEGAALGRPALVPSVVAGSDLPAHAA